MNTPEDRQQVDQLVSAALERDPSERVAFLSESCSSDPELLAQVVSLVAEREQSANVWESDVSEAATRPIRPSAAGFQGRVVPDRIEPLASAIGLPDKQINKRQQGAD